MFAGLGHPGAFLQTRERLLEAFRETFAESGFRWCLDDKREVPSSGRKTGVPRGHHEPEVQPQGDPEPVFRVTLQLLLPEHGMISKSRT